MMQKTVFAVRKRKTARLIILPVIAALFLNCEYYEWTINAYESPLRSLNDLLFAKASAKAPVNTDEVEQQEAATDEVPVKSGPPPAKASLKADDSTKQKTDDNPSLTIGMRAKDLHGFVPSGWKATLYSEGDLNKDGVSDQVVVIEKNDPKNVSSGMNFNPRVMLLLLADGSGAYTLAAKSDVNFLPPEYSRKNPCLADPLSEAASNGFTIKNGVLRVEFVYKNKRSGSNCENLQGSNLHRFIFRYQNDEFELIGMDREKLIADGQSNWQISVSINFSTKALETQVSLVGRDFSRKGSGRIDTEKLYNLGNSHLMYKEIEDTLIMVKRDVEEILRQSQHGGL